MAIERSDRNILVWLFGVVAILYTIVGVGMFAYAAHHGVPASHIIVSSGDATDYFTLAQAMLSSHRFALSATSSPEFFRLPGYPLFLAMLFSVTSSLYVIPAVQSLLMGINCCLVYLIGKKYFSRGVALAAAVVFALDPTMWLLAMTALTETFYVFLILSALALLAYGRGLQHVALAGILIGASALERPVGLFLVPLFALFAAVPWRGWNSAARDVVLFLLFAALTIAPWMLRNERLAGHFAVSSVSAYNILFYNVVEFENYRGTPKDAFTSELEAQIGTTDNLRLRSFEFASQETVLDEHYLGGANFLPYVAFHLEKTAPFFIGSSIEATDRELHNTGVLAGAPAPAVNISNLVLHGHISAALAALSNNMWGLLERLFWILVCISAFVYACVRMLKRSDNALPIAFFCLLILAAAVLAGPISEPRYRIPVEPFLLMLAFAGMYAAYRWVRGSRSTALQ